jgi:hypothetical protein
MGQNEQLVPPNHSYGPLARILRVLRRPLLGPLLFGIVLGGIPIGGMFFRWGVDRIAVNLDGLLYRLTPVAAVLSAWSAELSSNKSWQRLLWRAFVSSIAVCVPVPVLVWSLMAWHLGYEVFDARNFPFVFFILTTWALMITGPSWLLSLGYANSKDRRGQVGRVARPL